MNETYPKMEKNQILINDIDSMSQRDSDMSTLKSKILRMNKLLNSLEEIIKALEMSSRINKNLNQENKKTNIIQRKFQKVNKEFKEWSLLTKFDCYSKIFQTKSFVLQLFWLSLFLIFTGLTAYLLFKNITDYFAYETVSKIEIVYENPTKFPVVTICNSNPFTTPIAEELISIVSFSNYGFEFSPLDSWSMISNYSSLYELVKLNTNRYEYGDVNRKLLGNEIIINKCLFKNQPCSIEKDFSWYFSYLYGNCLQFNKGLMNSSVLYETTTEGPTYGLSLILQMPPNQNKYPSLSGDGFKLYIHNQSFDPLLPAEINLDMGKEIDVSISRTFSSKTPYPYSECQDSTMLTSYQIIFKDLNKTYRQYDCFKMCSQQKINDICGCNYPRYLILNKNIPTCINLTQSNCVLTQISSFSLSRECIEQCPLECNTITYDVELSSLEYPSQSLYINLVNSSSFVTSFENYTGRVFSLESMKKNVISLKIYYPFMFYTLITESPKTNFFDLLAQIGGSLGMLLGFSIFHFIELVEIILLLVLNIFF